MATRGWPFLFNKVELLEVTSSGRRWQQPQEQQMRRVLRPEPKRRRLQKQRLQEQVQRQVPALQQALAPVQERELLLSFHKQPERKQQ
jgi:hypothetical protein